MDDQTPPPPPPRTDERAPPPPPRTYEWAPPPPPRTDDRIPPPPPTDSTITTDDHFSDRINDMELVVLKPKVGTIFNSEIEAHDYYASYAKAKGFGAVTKTSKKPKDGIKSNITYGRHRSGKPRKKALNPVIFVLATKIDCKAHMNISLQVEEKWRLNSVELNHNHEMDPDKASYLKCYRTVPPHTRRTIELSAASGIRLNKTIASCVIEAGGHDNLTWLEKDARNYKDKVRRLRLKEGDDQAMYNYFVKMQKDNGDFYAIDADEDNRLRNVFWADARSRVIQRIWQRGHI